MLKKTTVTRILNKVVYFRIYNKLLHRSKVEYKSDPDLMGFLRGGVQGEQVTGEP